MSGSVLLTLASISAGMLLQTAARGGQQSRSASVGAVSPSVIASFQSHGANDFVRADRSPNGALPPPPLDQDWILDLLVLWRWSEGAPELRQGAVGEEVGGSHSVHRLTLADRELRLQFDPKMRTARIIDGPVVQLDGANVLMLDVDGSNVKVAGLAMIDARYPSTLAADPVAVLIARSSEVTAFVNQAR